MYGVAPTELARDALALRGDRRRIRRRARATAWRRCRTIITTDIAGATPKFRCNSGAPASTLITLELPEHRDDEVALVELLGHGTSIARDLGTSAVAAIRAIAARFTATSA